MPNHNSSNDEIVKHFIADQSELTSKSGSWELNLITNELFWSEGIYKIIDREPNSKKLSSVSELEIIHPDDLDFVLKKKKEALEKGTEYRIKKRIITDSHTIKHIFSFGKVIFDQHNKPIKFIGLYLDISEYIEIEEKNKLVNKLSNDVIYEWDIQKDEFTWSEGFKNFIDYEIPNDKISLNEWKKFIHPVDFKNEDENWIQFINNPKATEWTKEFRFKRKQDSYCYVEETAILIRDYENKPMKMIGIIKDISERKTIEIQKRLQSEISKLFQKEEKTDLIFESVLTLLLQNTDFVGAELWITKSSEQKIALKCSSHKNGNIDINASFDKGNGLPGILWKKKKYQIWADKKAIDEHCSISKMDASESNSVLGIPLIKVTQFVGTLFLFSKENFEVHPYETNAYISLDRILGIEITRKISEEINQLMFDSASEIITIANSNGYFIKVNPALCNLLGYTEQELTAIPFINFIHPDDIIETKNEYNSIVSLEKNANEFINRYRTKNGDYKWISWNTSETFGDENNFFAHGKNITEMKELEILFEKTSSLAEIGSWEYDISDENNPIFLSNVLLDILELNNDTKIDLKFLLNLTHPDDRNNTKIAFQQLILYGVNFDIEFQIITPNNNHKWVRCIGKEQKDYTNGTNKVLGSFQNITKQKNTELKLEQRNIILSSITAVTTELMHSNNWYESLFNAFAITGNTIDVDRIYYFEIDNFESGTKTFSQKLEWSKKNSKKPIKNTTLKYIPVSELSDLYEQLKRGKIFFGITSQLKEGAFKLIMDSQDIKSFLIYPVIFNEKLLGFIGFDDFSKERVWTDTEISFLSNITYNLTASLQKKIYNLELEKSLVEKNNILESIDDAFISIEKDWTVNYWNKKAEQLSELRREKIIGKNFWDLFPHLFGTPFEKKLNRAIISKKSINFQNHFKELDIWLDVTAYPSTHGLSVYFKDITRTKKYENELRLSNDRFEKSSAATNDAIWDWDLKNNTLYRGEGFLKQFGYDVPKFIYHDDILSLFKAKMKPKKADKIIKSIIKAINDPNILTWKKDYWYLKQNGKYAYVTNNAIIIRDKNKNAIRIVGALQDITYRKEQEKALLDLNKKLEMQAKSLIKTNQELEHFAYVASHDLQEPLRMVTSFLTQLEKKYKEQLDDKGKEYIKFAVDGAKRMRNIIIDVLEYSKLSQLEDTYEQVDVNEIIRNVCITNRDKILETDAIINYNNLPVIITSKFPLTQIFHNLIGNAIKYQNINNKPNINIFASENDKNWTFEISDNGIGIENEYYEKIFVIFQRLHTKREYGGNGLGLAIVKKLIENLNGKIWVESQINKGTTFYFTLPKNEKTQNP